MMALMISGVSEYCSALDGLTSHSSALDVPARCCNCCNASATSDWRVAQKSSSVMSLLCTRSRWSLASCGGAQGSGQVTDAHAMARVRPHDGHA